MKVVEKKSAFSLSYALSYLPVGISHEITEYLEQAGVRQGEVNEIRLRSHGPVSLVVSGENVALGARIGREEMKETFKKICGGAVFAHRDDVCRGFITLGHGVRVGVAGHARYEGGAIVGVGEISALAFRIPSGRCSFSRELYREWLSLGGGMLICSRAGEGKTTAIRSLARLIGSGPRPRRVVVVDERCEFGAEEYTDSHVDILLGYKRALGVDIAVRTMSAEVMIVDEISSAEDSAALMSALGAGIDVIATVHAPCLGDALARGYVRELALGGLFKGACIIERKGQSFTFRVEGIDPENLERLHGNRFNLPR